MDTLSLSSLSLMASSSSRRQHPHSLSTRETFVSAVILPAIRRKTCPICLKDIHDRRAAVITVCMHAYCLECIRKWSSIKRTCPLCIAHFNSWFFDIDLCSGTFQKKHLSALVDDFKLKETNFEASLNPRYRLAAQRVVRRSRDELNSENWRSRPLPWRRSFGRPGSVHPDVVAERILQWRASIYNRGLQAVPSSSRNRALQSMAGNNGIKERILGRIEPWIRRELQAMLGDPDPTIIVHVASSLFMSSLEEKHMVPSRYIGDENSYLAPLRPFLHGRTNMFWHELRCFAESSLTMEAYDAVVEYKQD